MFLSYSQKQLPNQIALYTYTVISVSPMANNRCKAVTQNLLGMPTCILVRDEPWCALVEADSLHEGVMSELIRVICQIDACCSAELLRLIPAIRLSIIGPCFQCKCRERALNEKDEKAPWLLAPVGTTTTVWYGIGW